MGYTIMGQSIIAGLATVLGAGIVLFLGHPGKKTLALLLGFAAGVMSGVVIFDLLPSALVYSNLLLTVFGFFCGLFFMFLLELAISFFPALKKPKTTESKGHFLKMGYLIALGIALHDLPEGIAIAVGYAAQENLGLLIALAIGLHNIPEGMATAAPLVMGGVSTRQIIFVCLLISLFTPLGALLGIYLVSLTSHFISLLLALAGGAMTFLVKNELLPESYRHSPGFARGGFLLGIFLIITLDLFF